MVTDFSYRIVRYGRRAGFKTAHISARKSVELLERIIQASSNEGDVVLDPFCGCERGIAAEQKLNR